jgi:hypothetical protein
LASSEWRGDIGSAVAFVYAVPRRDLLAVPGSRRQEIVDAIAKDYWQLDKVAQCFEDDDLSIDLAGAVAQIINGEELHPDLGSLYLYAIEAICWYLGSTLVLPIGFCGEQCIDEVLAARGCRLRVSDLVFSGSPLPIPEPGDPPSIGWWTPETIAAGGPAVMSLNLDGVDRETAAGVAEIRRWLSEAMDMPDGCLVGTYY